MDETGFSGFCNICKCQCQNFQKFREHQKSAHNIEYEGGPKDHGRKIKGPYRLDHFYRCTGMDPYPNRRVSNTITLGENTKKMVAKSKAMPIDNLTEARGESIGLIRDVKNQINSQISSGTMSEIPGMIDRKLIGSGLPDADVKQESTTDKVNVSSDDDDYRERNEDYAVESKSDQNYESMISELRSFSPFTLEDSTLKSTDRVTIYNRTFLSDVNSTRDIDSVLWSSEDYKEKIKKDFLKIYKRLKRKSNFVISIRLGYLLKDSEGMGFRFYVGSANTEIVNLKIRQKSDITEDLFSKIDSFDLDQLKNYNNSAPDSRWQFLFLTNAEYHFYFKS